MKSTLILVALVLAVNAGSGVKAAPQPATESEWITYLARFTGLQYRLSGTTTIDRYIDILSTPGYIGIDAEKTDFSSGVKSYRSFRQGEATGGTWLKANPGGGLANYKFTIPNQREYIIEATIVGGNQTWKIDDLTMEITGPGEETLTRTRVGDVTLEAGDHEITVALPGGGGLDRIDLITSGIAEIAPNSGFKPQDYLRYRLKAETMIRAIDSLRLLPVMPEFYQLIEAEDFKECAGNWKLSSDRSFGKPTGKGWISSQGASPVYLLELPVNGIYLIKARMLGNQRLISEFDYGKNKFFFPVTSPDRLDWTEVGTFYLPGGKHSLKFDLATETGIDVIEITRLADKPEDFLSLLFLLGFSEEGLNPEQEIPSGVSIEVESAWEGSPPSGFALKETGNSVKDANGTVVISASGSRDLLIPITPEESSHYSMLLRFQGEDSLPLVIREQSGRIIDQRLLFPKSVQELTWVPIVGNIPLEAGETYSLSLAISPGTEVDTIKLIPAIFPWEKLQELADQEVDRDSADKNLSRMMRLFGTEPTTETGISPIEPEEDQDEDDIKEFGPASPSLPEPVLINN